MVADLTEAPIVHFVGSIPLPDAETVFRRLAQATGPYLQRLPDGETGIRKTWIRFLQQVLADNPAIEVATDVAPFKFTQWDGKLLREIPRLRVKPHATLDPATFETGYADMAIASWKLFERLQRESVIPTAVKFQISLPTPIAPTYNNMVPSDRPATLLTLTRHLIGEVTKIAAEMPNDRIALQWDVCQEVLAWEGYYEPGPVDFQTETIEVLTRSGDAVPTAIELGYHMLRQSGGRALRPAQRHGDHGRDRECHQRRCWPPGSVLPYASAKGAHRRRLFRTARQFAPASRDQALSRAGALRRCDGRCGANCRSAAARTRRRRCHRMRHGAWRPCAAAVIVGRARPGSTGRRSELAPVMS